MANSLPFGILYNSYLLVPIVFGGNAYLSVDGLPRCNRLRVSVLHSHGDRGNERRCSAWDCNPTIELFFSEQSGEDLDISL